VSDRRDSVVPALKRELRDHLHVSKRIEQLSKRYPHEPYRLLLGVLRERLAQAVNEVRDGTVLSAETVVGACLGRTTIEETLETIRASLVAGKGAMLVDGDLKALSEQFEVFGLHTARLDIRQHSSQHEAAVAEVFDPRRLPEAARSGETHARLLAAAATAELLPAAMLGKFSSATRHVLDPLALAARASAKFGPESLGIAIISMTDGVSDVLELEYLQAVAGAALPIAPVVEDAGRS